MNYIILTLALINLIVFTAYGIDKYKAVKDKWRVRESTLIGLAAVAPWGAMLGMWVFRHKIRKSKFYLVYVFAVLHAAIIIWWFYLR